MIKFSAAQHTVEIGGVVFGGQPGEFPTVLCGSIFYPGHRIVSDHQRGVFDRDAARELLKREAELSRQTGNPRAIDVIGETGLALTRYVEFVAENSDCAILVDSPFISARLEVYRHFARTSVAKRLIYNSIDAQHSESDMAAIAKAGVQSAMILAFSSRALKPSDKLTMLCGEGLISKSQEAGVTNILVDVGCLDVPGTAWGAVAIREVKEALGCPAGLAPSNAFHTWLKGESRTVKGIASGAAIYTLPIFNGGDFIFYGPIRNAEWVYPACAAADAMVAYAGRLHGVKPKTGKHPLFRIF